MKLFKPLFFGIIASLGALFLELLLSLFLGSPEKLSSLFFSTLSPLLIAAILIEEFLKFIFIYKNFQQIEVWMKSSDEENNFKRATLLDSFLIGLGFSCLELFFILLNLPGQSLHALGLTILGTAAIHILTAGVIGYLVVAARKMSLDWTAKTLLIAFSLHFIYNYLIIYDFQPGAILLYLSALLLTLITMIIKIKSAPSRFVA
ncbi:MAG: hypothetical protein CO141_00965 [Candidatus Moranbacteria bacterium CG_4_9_14_3_um_filter_42_9]|nr:MAG: hypothetical protein CO141_00965 [Candidatus Moranbacteria bacterium CG_4_9_14_3_um_filter_42_9]